MTVQKRAGQKPARKKSAKSTKATKSSDTPPPALSDAEASDLDRFCESIQCEEISFDTWEKSHKHLDLTVPIWLSAADMTAGGERQVKYSRTVRASVSAPPERQPTTCQVHLPNGCQNGHRLVVKGQGDKTASQTGDLIVIVYVKS